MFCSDCFNSRTRVGATRGRRKQETPYTEFQFTHPCGCDPPCLTATHPATRFNSRTRVGATLGRPYLRIPDSVSIHAPVWVRRHTLRTVRRVRGFQFTHPCGCDNWTGGWSSASPCFNSRTRVGATFQIFFSVTRVVFQFTHPCGCDGG